MQRKTKLPFWRWTLYALAALVLAEGAARVAENFIVPVESRPYWAFLAGRPAPYADSGYFSRAFVNEMRRQPGSWVTPHGTTLKLPNNFHGRWFNTLNGARLTLGQPDKAQHTLWLVGGSAVYDAEVPDAFTIASQMQNLLSKRGGGWRIENIGTPGVTVAGEVERLHTLPLKEGDVVVFYDGAADAAALAPGVAASALVNHSALVRLFAGKGDKKWTPSDVAVANMITVYGNALDDAAHYVGQHKAHFVQVLQPMLFTQPTLSTYEQRIAANPALITAPQKAALVAAYAQLRLALPQLAAHSGWQYADFAEVLNGTDEYYLGYATTNERAGALLAGYLLDLIYGPVPAAK